MDWHLNARRIVALILSPLLSKMLNVWATSLFTEVLVFDTQMYLRELLGLEKLLHYWIWASLLLSFILFDRALSRAAGDGSNGTTTIVEAMNPPYLDVTYPQSAHLADSRLLLPLTNLGSLSEEMEEAFARIAKGNQDVAITSISASQSSSVLNQILQSPTAKRTRRDDFSWRFSPVNGRSDFERTKRQLWAPKPGTSRATIPLRQHGSEL